MKKYVAEALGCFALTLAVGLSLSHTFTLSTAVMAGLTLALLAYSVGTEAGKADGYGAHVHCCYPLKPVSFLFSSKKNRAIGLSYAFGSSRG